VSKIEKFGDYTKAVEHAKELLGAALRNWIALIQHLRGIENSGLWTRGPNSSGWAHFGDFLRQEFPGALGLERYRNGVQLIETDGEEFAAIVGLDCAHLLTGKLLMDHPQRRQQLKATILDQHRTTGVAPKADVIRSLAHRILADVAPRPQPRRVASIEEARALRTENHALKQAGRKSEGLAAECQRLRAENAKLKAEVKELRAKLRRKAA
jgi:hypothetical protein